MNNKIFWGSVMVVVMLLFISCADVKEAFEYKDTPAPSADKLTKYSTKQASYSDFVNLGVKFEKLKDYKQARQNYEKALNLSRLHDVRSRLFLAIGNTFLKEKNYKQAKVSYEKALKLSHDKQIKSLLTKRIAFIEKQK